MSYLTIREKLLSKSYEILGSNYSIKNNCKLVKKFYPDIKTFVDIGASTGTFIKGFKREFPNCKIYAFEPVEESFIKLKKDFPEVDSYNLALGSENKTKVFFENKSNAEGSNLVGYEETKGYIDNNDIKKQEINIKRFDDLNISIQSPCFTKIDTNGYELEVLKGMQNKLKEIDILQVEIIFPSFFKRLDGKSKISEIISFLSNYGFNVFIQQNIHVINGTIAHCDLIFFKDKN
ncbi:MAG: FkbM family methyltransferase [Nanoarchaeota archaeon]